MGELPSPAPVSFPLAAPPASITVSSGAVRTSAPVVVTGGTAATTTAHVAAAALTAPRGVATVIDGRGSTNATTFRTVIKSGPQGAVLVDDTTSTPRIVLPTWAAPTDVLPRVAPAATPTVVTFTASDGGASSSIDVTVTPAGDTVAVTTARSVAGRAAGGRHVDDPRRDPSAGRADAGGRVRPHEPGARSDGHRAGLGQGRFRRGRRHGCVLGPAEPGPAPDVAYVQYLMQTSRGTLLSGPLGGSAPTGPVAVLPPVLGALAPPPLGCGNRQVKATVSASIGIRAQGWAAHTGAQEHHMKIPSRTGVTAGVTTGLQPDERPRGRRRAVVAGLVATGLVSSSLILPGVAAAAVPAFPDNIVVFPNRDMVVLEGFDGLAGSPVTIEVYEDGGNVLKGSTTGTPAAGAEFEINHPGGACWGVGAPANLQVTPDIDKNDRVVIKQDGAEVADTIVQDVTAGTAEGADANLTVQSQIGAGVNRNFLEQRIVNPDLTGTAVARRDLRALPGGLVVDRNNSYQSGLDAQSGLATYVFNDPAIAATARRGRRRAPHGLAGRGRRRQPPGPDHRRGRRARRPRDGRLPRRSRPDRQPDGRLRRGDPVDGQDLGPGQLDRRDAHPRRCGHHRLQHRRPRPRRYR